MFRGVAPLLTAAVGGSGLDLVDDAELAPAQLPHRLVLLQVILSRQELVRVAVAVGTPVAEDDAVHRVELLTLSQFTVLFVSCQSSVYMTELGPDSIKKNPGETSI